MLAETYELEGLLLLAQQRGDETPEYVMTAIAEKIERLAAGLDVEEKSDEAPEERFYSEPKEPTAPNQAEQDETDVNDEPEIADIQSDDESEQVEETSAIVPESYEVTEESMKVLEAVELTDDREESVTEAVVIESIGESHDMPIEEYPDESIVGESVAIEKSDDEGIFEGTTEEPFEISVAEESAHCEFEAKDTPTSPNPSVPISSLDKPIRLDERLQRNCSKDLHSAFSLNDKFRFSRELFGNSTAEMSDAVNLVEAMHSYDEAEEYFYGDLGWNRESDEVKEFMDVIKKHFLN